MSTLTWLHISDWHQSATHYDRTFVRDSLMKDIRECRLKHPELSRIDFIVFSGDLANSGTTAEYNLAIMELFVPLMEATGLRERLWENLLVVPGNHDLDRRVLMEAGDDLLRDPLGGIQDPMKKRVAINSYLDDPRKRTLLLSPFSGFHNFVLNLKEPTGRLNRQTAYYQVRRIERDGKRIGFVGFNSALLSYRNKDAAGRTNDYGHLVIGEPPLNAGLEEIQGEDVRVAVMHHPLSWLADFDRDMVEERLFQTCHFVLHGHQHLPRVHVIGSTIGETVNIPAGAVYSRRYEDNSRYTNSYNFTHIDFKTRHGTVFLRRWEERGGGGWRRDDAYQPGGRFHFIMPKSIEPAKRNDYHGQASRLIGKFGERFCTSYDVTVRSVLQECGKASVVRQEVSHHLRLCPGKPETFTAEVELSGNNRVVSPAATPDADAPCLKLNGRPLDTVRVEGNKIIYTASLDEQEAKIEYKYVILMRAEDFLMVVLRRFTRHFALSVEKDAGLNYEFVKLGGLPARPSYRYSAKTSETYETEEGELCCPRQGLIIQWYPK